MMTRGPRVHTIMSTLPTNNLVQLMFYPRGVEMKLKEVELQPCLGGGRGAWSRGGDNGVVGGERTMMNLMKIQATVTSFSTSKVNS